MDHIANFAVLHSTNKTLTLFTIPEIHFDDFFVPSVIKFNFLSTTLKSVPPTKSFVRGISYITGYLIRATSENPDLPGCELIYVTQSDPKGLLKCLESETSFIHVLQTFVIQLFVAGNLPSWVVNKATQWLAPKVCFLKWSAFLL